MVSKGPSSKAMETSMFALQLSVTSMLGTPVLLVSALVIQLASENRSMSAGQEMSSTGATVSTSVMNCTRKNI